MLMLRSPSVSGRLLQHQRLILCVPGEIQQRRQIGLYQRYENFLEKRYPRVYRMHRLIVDGCKSCGSDIKNYYLIRRDLKSGKRSVDQLTQTELFNYLQTTQEAIKLIIIAIVAPLPLVFYALAAAIVFFPRHVLTRHFWTEDQKQKFWAQIYNKSHKPEVHRLIEFTRPAFTKNVPISSSELSNVKLPDLNDLDLKHLFHVFRLHNISLFSGTNGLKKHAILLAQLDKIMAEDKEAIDKLSDIQLKNHLFLRRLDFTNKSTDEMRQILRDWTTNLKPVAKEPTLYLHAPVLLSSNKT